MKLEKPAGSSVALVRITGERRNNEPAHVRICFPGGDVEVVRARDGEHADYWVHIRVNRPSDGQCVDGEDDMAKIIDARIDIRGGEQRAVEFRHPETYHVAVRVCRDGIYRLLHPTAETPRVEEQVALSLQGEEQS